MHIVLHTSYDQSIKVFFYIDDSIVMSWSKKWGVFHRAAPMIVKTKNVGAFGVDLFIIYCKTRCQFCFSLALQDNSFMMKWFLQRIKRQQSLLTQMGLTASAWAYGIRHLSTDIIIKSNIVVCPISAKMVWDGVTVVLLVNACYPGWPQVTHT